MSFFERLLAKRTEKSREDAFWAWFVQNEDALYHFERDQRNVFAILSAALDRVDEHLTFEFGPEADVREFVISAGGIKGSFPQVEALAELAPTAKLTRWKITRFRPRRPLMRLLIEGVEIEPTEVRYQLFDDEDPSKVGLTLFVPGYDESGRDDTAVQFGFLYLDQALGEYNVAMRLGHIHFLPWHADGYLASRPLAELGEEFDARFAD